MFIRFFRQPAIDPLQVSMTGVKMGEKFVMLGCDDAVLLAGLGEKVGMSGACSLIAFDEHQAVRGRTAASRTGFLLETTMARDGTATLDESDFDLAVVDDTQGAFANRPPEFRTAALACAYSALRKGGRIEVVEGLGSSGIFGKATERPQGYDAVKELEAAAFKPVRVLAEVTSFRFVEGVKV